MALLQCYRAGCLPIFRDWFWRLAIEPSNDDDDDDDDDGPQWIDLDKGRSSLSRPPNSTDKGVHELLRGYHWISLDTVYHLD